MLARDRAIVGIAEKIIPVSIRPKGKLATLLAEEDIRAKINSGHEVSYEKGRDKPEYDLEDSALIPETVSALQDCVVHWTRSSHAPYEGESWRDYYREIVESRTYPCSALHTLKHIAAQDRVTASNRFIRGEFKVVSFSASSPAQALHLMRWRKRYVYYNFEPYGVAIAKSVARRIGIRPVFYGDKCDYEMLSEEDRPFFQTAGSDAANWTPELEWRYLGSIDLGSLPEGSVKFVVYRAGEKAEIASETNREVLSLFH